MPFLSSCTRLTLGPVHYYNKFKVLTMTWAMPMTDDDDDDAMKNGCWETLDNYFLAVRKCTSLTFSMLMLMLSI